MSSAGVAVPVPVVEVEANKSKNSARSKRVYTLAFIQNVEQEQVLLGYKKRGFAQGVWNGFGGKVNPGETIVEAAIREIAEECGLTVAQQDLEEFAVIDFEFVGVDEVMEVHIFQTTKYSGHVHESEEMLPRWYDLHNPPYDMMWIDDAIWYPLYLKGVKFKGYFLFEGHKKILNYHIRDWFNEDVTIVQSSDSAGSDGKTY